MIYTAHVLASDWRFVVWMTFMLRGFICNLFLGIPEAYPNNMEQQKQPTEIVFKSPVLQRNWPRHGSWTLAALSAQNGSEDPHGSALAVHVSPTLEPFSAHLNAVSNSRCLFTSAVRIRPNPQSCPTLSAMMSSWAESVVKRGTIFTLFSSGCSIAEHTAYRDLCGCLTHNVHHHHQNHHYHHHLFVLPIKCKGARG